MNAKILIAIATFAAGGHAAAADYTPFTLPAGGSVARSTVQAEARQAVTAGDVVVGEAAQVPTDGVSGADRSAVRATTAQANRAGQLAVGELLSFERRALRVRAG